MNLIDKILFEAIKHKRVKSSNLKSVGYDKNTWTLELTFRSGSTYEYLDVPPKVYKDLMRAKSKGSYAYWNICYEYEYYQLN